MTAAGERGLLALALLAWALKVAFHSGAPRLLLTATLWAAALLAVGLVLLRRSGQGWLDAWRLPLVLLALYALPEVYGGVGGDGIQYYVLLRSPVLDLDFDLANDFEGLGAPPVLSFDTGQPTSRMPIGTALLWLPPFLLTHALLWVAARLGAPLSADGFSAAYQATVGTATYVYCVAALLLLEHVLRRRYGPPIALVAVLGIWLATPLYFYMVANPSMSHGASAFAATLFVLGWLRAREGPPEGTDRTWTLVGVAGGLMAAIRPQDAVLLALPLLDLARRGRRGSRPAVLLLAGPCLVALLQVAVWLRLYGLDFAQVISRQSYVGHTALQPLALLFSARHGLFTWTPIALLAVAGLVLWARRSAWLAALLLLGFTLSVLVNSAMQDWWGSESFGQRRLLGLTPLFALGLAETLHALRRRPLWPIAAGVFALVLWNRQLAYLYNSETLARRNEAVSLDRLAGAQVDALYRSIMHWERWLPRRASLLVYENLKGIWLDEGPRSLNGTIDLGSEPPDLPEIVGHNWYKPTAVGEPTFRRSRGRRSWLRVPIRTPDAFSAVLRARSEMAEEPVEVEVQVNGRSVGRATLTREWGEHVFEVPAEAVTMGFNDVALSWSTNPRAADPEHHGKDAAAAVDWMRWQRRSRRQGPI